MALKIKMFFPPNAEEVKVHKAIDPYKILITPNIKNFYNTISRINEKLRIESRRIEELNEGTEDNKSKLAIGTLTIVHKKMSDKVDLPAWHCRALITGFDEKKSKYSAFLVDYGDIVKMNREAFMEVSPTILSDPYLTEFIGLYNILPVSKYHSKKDKPVKLNIEPKWTSEAIDLMKSLLSVSETVYFEIQSTYQNKRKYGELHLVINKKLIPLTKALIHAYVAISCLNNTIHSNSSIELNNLEDSTTTDKSSEDILDKISKCQIKDRRFGFDDIFVNSELECKPLNNIIEAKYPKGVHKGLKQLSINNLWKIQSHMWSAIAKGFDVLAVAPIKHGKTFGFIPPITNIIIKIKNYQEKNFPLVLILCETSIEVLKTYAIFMDLLPDHYKEIRVIAAHNGCTDRSVTAQIFNGCHVFISTPPFLLRYLSDEHHREILKFNYISHLVIDNLDMMIKKYLTSLNQLLYTYTPVAATKQNNLSDLMAVQIIATSRTWSVDVEKFIRIFNNPYICIGSFADAAIFCRTKLRTRLVLKERKKERVKGLLGNIYKMVKTMIICANDEEAVELNEYLKDNFDTLLANTEMVFTDISVIKDSWSASISGMYKLLICTDEVLPDLNITDVDWLIHYSIAVSCKSTFLFRFSTLMANLKKKSPKSEVTILIDDSNDVQLRGVLDLVQRSGYNFSSEQLSAFEKIYINIEYKKKAFAICDNIKTLGSCSTLSTCTYRHCFISDVDTPTCGISIGDEIKFIITYIHSATHFSAKILAYINNEREEYKISEKDHAFIVSKVSAFYANKENRRKIKTIVAGGFYGYDTSFDQYQRVQVINITKYDDRNNPSVVDIRCIDSGLVYKHQRVSKLVQLPEELAKAPSYIVEIFLTNIQPYDQETEWNNYATECTERWFKTELRMNNFLQAKVCLRLGYTLWVDPLEVRMKIPGRGEIVNSSLKRHLIKNKHGINYEDHLKTLMKMCFNAGIISVYNA
ncbi:putative ATP-dependent RNA helicase TDRD12 [Chelonus insularis]|uniref:putative ATP-dependent RNA helicase TDRD12 n=1 Tax=Chelonus insularis TaxID=460826 RepID=UPI00158F0F5A|nr:putative ATP-dependent RNA helicase TDRD12 [Chelonus insularis]